MVYLFVALADTYTTGFVGAPGRRPARAQAAYHLSTTALGLRCQGTHPDGRIMKSV